MRAHNNARDAEAALHRGADGEGAGEHLALALVDALERDDVAMGRLVGGHGAGDLGLAVDEDGAAAALARRRAAVFGRGDAAPLAQDLEEGRTFVGVDRPRAAVDGQLDARHLGMMRN